MKYTKVVPGVFLCRPNRFIAHVRISGREQVCHVKNTGRCRELLPEGAGVWCYDAGETAARKTRYDLIAVEKNGILINMDSQAPNKAVQEWLAAGGIGPVTQIKPEKVYGGSRIDFSFVKDGRPCLMEVKGVTLETDGVCAFPDAPTQRGTRHLRELTDAHAQGYDTYILFVIQMKDVAYLRPNDETDPAFGAALREAASEGVNVLAFDCEVAPDCMSLRQPVEVRL